MSDNSDVWQVLANKQQWCAAASRISNEIADGFEIYEANWSLMSHEHHFFVYVAYFTWRIESPFPL